MWKLLHSNSHTTHIEVVGLVEVLVIVVDVVVIVVAVGIVVEAIVLVIVV